MSLRRPVSLGFCQVRLSPSPKTEREIRRSVGGSRVAYVLSLNPGVGWVAAVSVLPGAV